MVSQQREPRALQAHPIDELFEAVDERVGLPERDKALAARGILGETSRSANNAKRRRSEIEQDSRRQAWRRRQRNVRANSSGEQLHQATPRKDPGRTEP